VLLDQSLRWASPRLHLAAHMSVDGFGRQLNVRQIVELSPIRAFFQQLVALS
jgi:hypothetical protein